MPETASQSVAERPAATTDLDARYGRSPRRRLRTRTIAIIAGVGVIVVVVAWVIWAGLFSPASQLDAHETGYVNLTENSIGVKYEVTVNPGTEVSCAVQALNAGFAIVGWKIVHLPASDDRNRSFVETVRTTERPATGLIYRCWLT